MQIQISLIIIPDIESADAYYVMQYFTVTNHFEANKGGSDSSSENAGCMFVIN